MEIKCSVMAIFYAYVLEREVVSKSTHFKTMKNRLVNSLEKYPAILGMTGMTNMIVGIIAGVLGIILVALAYPVYSKVLKREREKIAPEIIKLSDELMK